MGAIARFTVASDCGCCGGGTPQLDVGPCESLTGTASLCGISGFSSDAAPYDAGDPWAWEGQLRKWQFADQSAAGEVVRTVTTYAATCDVGPGVPADGGSSTFSGGGTVTYDCDGCTTIGAISYTRFGSTSSLPIQCGESSCTLGARFELTSCSPPTVDGSVPGTAVSGARTRTLTTDVIEFTGQSDSQCVSSSIKDELSATFVISTELSQERYFYDALQDKLDEEGEESGVAEGDECCTSLDVADLTTPESIDPIVMTGTAVRRRLYVYNCEPGTYVVIVTLSQGIAEDYEEFDIEVLVECDNAIYFYLPLPRPGDDPICWVSAALAA